MEYTYMFSHAEVSKFHHSIGVHKNVRPLNIPEIETVQTIF